jgi:hypothetical protein
MNLNKIAGIILIALAVIAAFVNIPYAALILALVGAFVGWGIEAESHVRVIVSAVALHAFAGTFGEIPGVGHYVTSVLGNIAIGLSGIAVLIILRNIYRRLAN